MTQYLSFDIGGTNLKYGLIDHSGHLIEKGRVPTKKDNLDVFMESIYQVADTYQGQFDGVAVCAPGKIDIRNKVIHFGGALPFLDGLNLQKTLGDKYQVPIGVENDGKAAALSEQWLGELKGVANGAAMTLGTGVGGGIVVNHQIIHGNTFQAGELSWMITNDGVGDKDLAAYAGASCSAVMMIAKINKALGNENTTDGLAAFEAIKAGKPEAVKSFQEFCHNVAVMILNVQTVINGEKIIIGGGISSQPILIGEIRRQFDQLLENNPMLGEQVTPPEIVAAKFKNNANLYGALYGLLLQLNNEE